MVETLRIYEFSYRGEAALLFYVSESSTFSTDEPYGRTYDVRSSVGRAFARAVDAMCLWVDLGEVGEPPVGWSFVESIEAAVEPRFAGETLH